MDKDERKKLFDIAFRLHSSGKVEEAKVLYEKILNYYPEDAEILNLKGLCELKLKNYDNAENLIKKAISIKKEQFFFESLSKVYFEQKKYKEELETLTDGEKLFGLNYDFAYFLGLSNKNCGNFEKAEEYYLKALEFNQKSLDLYNNLAILYLLLNKFEEAKECYEKSLEIEPDNRDAKYFLSLCLFRLKDYKNGLPYFESRLCRETAIVTEEKTYPNLISKSKIWEGEDISDKTLYTYYEAGFGDMIMFARYIPLLLKRCKKLIIKPQVELTQLFRENFPTAEVMDYFVSEQELDFDVHIPFLSVPYVLGLSNEEIFVYRDGYLKADSEKVKKYKEDFFNNDKFKIMIKWQGNTFYDTERVINTEAFDPLFDLKNVQVYSAQTFAGSEEFEKLSSKHNIIDISKSFKDFSYTAAAVENSDLVICNDTSLAHVAGAMNKPCIILLPYNYNWRWHTDLSYCDWYKSVSLALTGRYENWETLMERVVKNCKKEFGLS